MFNKEDTQVYRYLVNKASEYKNSPLNDENPIYYTMAIDSMGRNEIIMSEESAKVFEGFIKQFAQELGQGPSFIDTEFMNKMGQDNDITVVKGLTEDQLVYLSMKTWGNKNELTPELLNAVTQPTNIDSRKVEMGGIDSQKYESKFHFIKMIFSENH